MAIFLSLASTNSDKFGQVRMQSSASSAASSAPCSARIWLRRTCQIIQSVASLLHIDPPCVDDHAGTTTTIPNRAMTWQSFHRLCLVSHKTSRFTSCDSRDQAADDLSPPWSTPNLSKTNGVSMASPKIGRERLATPSGNLTDDGPKQRQNFLLKN